MNNQFHSEQEMAPQGQKEYVNPIAEEVKIQRTNTMIMGLLFLFGMMAVYQINEFLMKIKQDFGSKTFQFRMSN